MKGSYPSAHSRSLHEFITTEKGTSNKKGEGSVGEKYSPSINNFEEEAE